jgi:ABC-type transporter Mla subunit MlaD
LDEEVEQKLDNEDVNNMGASAPILKSPQQEKQMTTEQRLDNIDARLERLVTVAEQQGRDIERLASTVERLTGGFAEQARAISSLSQTVSRLVDASQRSAQAAETAAVIAQSNQVALRDLIEELRRDRDR